MNIDDIVSDAFGPVLNAMGFSTAGRRKWVRDQKAPIREIFVVSALKGSYFSPAWGFSLDFVPDFRGPGFSWKRTNKSCDFDLTIDPIDLTGNLGPWSFVHSPGIQEATVAGIELLANGAVAAAIKDFNRVTTLSDLEGLIDERSRMTFRRFGFSNYVQICLAWGLLLLRLGHVKEAEEKLAEFYRTHEPDRTDPILLKALNEAKEASNKSVDHYGSPAADGG